MGALYNGLVWSAILAGAAFWFVTDKYMTGLQYSPPALWASRDGWTGSDWSDCCNHRVLHLDLICTGQINCKKHLKPAALRISLPVLLFH